MKTFLMMGLLAAPALAASPELELAKAHDALLGGGVSAAKEKLACPEAWVETAGASVDGKRKYTVHRCASTEGQIYVLSDKVFALGLRLHSNLDGRRAGALHKEGKKGLTSGGCTITDRGQMALANCAGGRTLALLQNWDSKSDTHSISMLYGQSDVLLAVMGITVK